MRITTNRSSGLYPPYVVEKRSDKVPATLRAWIWLICGGRNGPKSLPLAASKATLRAPPRLFGRFRKVDSWKFGNKIPKKDASPSRIHRRFIAICFDQEQRCRRCMPENGGRTNRRKSEKQVRARS